MDLTKRGYRKLVEACRVATTYNLEYLWIDTCCIDKRNSAELSMEINRMFSWYGNAEVCLAYLEDVKSGPTFEETFRASVWLTRSWTLQELLAHRTVELFDGDWVYIGSKESSSSIIQDVSGIAHAVLIKECPVELCLIAERMS